MGFLAGSQDSCNNSQLAKQYEKWKKLKDDCDCSGNSIKARAKRLISFGWETDINKIQKEILSSINQNLDKPIYTEHNLRQILDSSKSKSDFLKAILITPKCERSRERIKHKVIYPAREVSHLFQQKANDNYRKVFKKGKDPGFSEFHEIYRKKGEEFLNRPDVKKKLIIKGLKDDSSVGISLDLGKVKGSWYPNGSHHALTIIGMRFNKRKNRCEIKLRNSWGEGASHHGWRAFSHYANSIDTTWIHYLK